MAVPTARGRRAPKIAEDELESIDLDMGGDPDDDEMDEDEEILAAAPVPKTTKSKRGAPVSPTKPKKPASKATPKPKTTTAKAKAVKAAAPSAKSKGKQPALFLSDPSDDDEEGADVAGIIDVSDGEYVPEAFGDSAVVSELLGDDREAAMTSTLRSTAGTQLRRAAARVVKKRPVAVLEDPDGDSDDDAVFKGFGGRKRGRIG